MAPNANRRWFMMPPAEKADTSAEEQKRAEDVYAILRGLTSHIAATRSEVRQARREQQEMAMKVSELSSKVDELISVAHETKRKADSAGSQTGVVSGGAPQEDDPQVQQLADRIDEAIKVLRGNGSSSSSPGNTPVPPFPSPMPEPAVSQPPGTGASVDPTTDVAGNRIVPEPNAPFNPSNP